MRKISKLALALFFSSTCLAQLIPKTPPTFPGQSSSSTEGCSLQKSCAELAPGMIQSALGDSPLEANLRYLTTAIGGRMTGTPANEKAVAWTVDAFRVADVSSVKTESFTLPTGWTEGVTVATVLSKEPFSLRLISAGWSPPVRLAAGITAHLVDVGMGDAASFARVGAEAHGAILLVHQKILATAEDLLNERMKSPAIIDRALRAHAAAIFWMSDRSGSLLYRHTSTPGGGVLEKIPQAVVARDDAEKLASMLAENQSAVVHFAMPNKISGPLTVKNVVAEIRGWDKPEEFVVLGAHLDSWDLGEGELDNGCNVAILIDAARVIHSSGSLPRRSIRFVLFNGEEQMFAGSRAYVAAHRAELDRAITAATFDSGSDAITGYSVSGRRDMLSAIRDSLEPLKSLGVSNFTDNASIETDNFDFLLEGVPTLLPNQQLAGYLPNYQAPSNTFDRVDIATLKKNSAIAAITAYAIADAPNRIAPRQSRLQVEQLLKSTGLDRQMQTEGFWADWQAGKRGRRP